MRNLIVFCFLFCTIGLAHAEEASPISRIAVERALEAYGKGGQTALKISSRDCYEHDLDKIFCIYLDTAAQQIDQPIADGLNMPRDTYFNGTEFLNRVGPILVDAGLNMHESNAFLRRCSEEVNAAMLRAAIRAAVQSGE